WVKLQMDELLSNERKSDVQSALKKLPKTLNETYSKTMERINLQSGSAPSVANRALQWLLCSRKPMNATFLVYALWRDPDDLGSTENGECDLKISFVLKACCNL